MVDINQWQLAYEGETFTFGDWNDGASDYPLKVQVDITEPERDTQDYAHPSNDGTIMGLEQLSGMMLTFECTVVPDVADPNPEKWDNPLDLYRTFKRKWRADAVRKTPGKYATLRNINRGVEVYGRPRRCAPTLDRIRRGSADWICDFQTTDPNFYSSTLRSSSLNANGQTVAFTNGGDARTWPVIYMSGAGIGAVSLQKYDASDALWRTLWSVQSYGNLFARALPAEPWEYLAPPTGGWLNDGSGIYISPADLATIAVPLSVDTRPWSRGSLAMTAAGIRNDSNGATPSVPMDRMFIPPSDNLRWLCGSTGATPLVKIFWREAFVGL